MANITEKRKYKIAKLWIKLILKYYQKMLNPLSIRVVALVVAVKKYSVVHNERNVRKFSTNYLRKLEKSRVTDVKSYCNFKTYLLAKIF